jgi:phage baseplate assembly protein V
MQRMVNELVARVSMLESQVSRVHRQGTVAEVDPAKQVVRISMGTEDDGKPFVGPWVPYAQFAGALKVHTPPSVGQTVHMLCPSGDFEQACAVPLTWSDQNVSPSQKGDENIITYGNVKIELRNGQLKATVGNTVVDITNGSVTIGVDGKGFTLTGDSLTMSQKFVGKGGSRPAHYKGGADSDGDISIDGNDQVLV